MNRYFQITALDQRIAKTIVEYNTDFGLFVHMASRNKFDLPMKGQRWFFSSNLPITKATCEKACIQLEAQGTVSHSVDLSITSNPKSQRQPAMKKRAKK